MARCTNCTAAVHSLISAEFVSIRRKQPSYPPDKILNLAECSLTAACHFGGKHAKAAKIANFVQQMQYFQHSEVSIVQETMPKSTSELPIISFETEADFEKWLEENGQSNGLWVKIAKKDSGHKTINYAQALDIALCFGWIDGQKNKFDEVYFLQKFTPRRAKSPWSKVNQDKVATLIAAGKMREAGLKEIERAKADGRWEAAYESQSKMMVPDDLQAELDKNPAAQAFFNTLNSTNRYAILYRVTTAKKAETRQARIAKFIDMLNKGEKIHN